MLLGETVIETDVDGLKAISEKLEVINLQLAQRKAARKSLYLGWNYSDPETAVIGVAFHSFEWLFVRVAPIIFMIAIIGIFLTRKKD